VSADDLDRADSVSNVAPVYSSSYSSSSNSAAASINDNSDATTIVQGEPVASASEIVDKLEERDGGGHHHHHHDHSAAEPQEAAAAPAQSLTPVSTGHLYYYYYPVAAQPLVDEKADTEIDPLVAVLLPITVLVGLLALLSIINAANNSGRSMWARSFGASVGSSAFDRVGRTLTAMQEEVDTMLVNYYQVLESDSCMDRLVCELGTKAHSLSTHDYLLTALDWITPQTMARKMSTFKMAVKKHYTPKQCQLKFSCKNPHIPHQIRSN